MDQLDVLQRELDKVLDQVGRVLAAKDSKTVMAAGTKLKHILPGAQMNFHDALDHLSEEIDFARLVMRRDLAIGQAPNKPEPEPSKVPTPAPAPEEGAPEPSKEKEATPPPAPVDAPSEAPDASSDNKPPDEKATEQQPAADTNTEDHQQQSQPQSTSNDLSTDNDNISALLPGLQDYANTQPDENTGGDGTADINFDEIFGTGDDSGVMDFGTGGDEQAGIGGGGDGGLGDFMDFDFEAEFGAAGGDTSGGDGTGNSGFGTGGLGDDEDFFKFD